MKNYLTEFVGTFFLVLTIGLTAASGTPMAPLAIGSVLMVMVYLGGHVSGAHYNPAVTLAIFVRGKLPSGSVIPYMVAQIVGALAASGVVYFLTNSTFSPAPGGGGGAAQAVLAEILFTFALALVVLNVATAKATEGNSFYGLAIGFTVLAGASAVGPISGGAFNPAVGIGPTLCHAIMGDGSYTNLWIYLVGPLTGAALAAGAYRVQHADDVS